MLLSVLMDQLVLGVLLVHLELLSVACDAGLARVDGPLDRGYHVKEDGVLLGVANIVEPLVLQCLVTS